MTDVTIQTGTSWHSYPSIFNLGHRAITNLMKFPVNVEEKIDGSQFSFGLIQFDENEPELKVRSKSAVMYPDAPEKMFTKGVEHVKSIQHLLHVGWTYRGEYLAKSRHNALAYDRVPAGYIIIFDINTGEESYLSYNEKKTEAEHLGLECVPLLFCGMLERIEEFRQFLNVTSILGGQKIEGVVIKPTNYDLYGLDKKVLMGKFVSEAYKEVHSNAWKEANPTGKDILTMLGDVYGTPTRWNKAIQHLRERGEIEDDVRDIGKIMKEVPEDILKECEEDIKERLFKWAWSHMRRSTTRGLAEFYKEQLLKRQFETSNGK